MSMLAANHWTEHRDPSGGVREKIKGAEGVYNPIGRTSISTSQTPPELPGTKPLTNEYTWRDPCMTPAAGWDCLASIGGKALGPVKSHFPQVGECQGIEVGVGGWEWEHPHRSRSRGRQSGKGGRG